MGVGHFAASFAVRDRIGSIGLVVVAAVLTILCAGAYLGSPPPSVAPLAIGNIVLVVPLLIIDWVDRHRDARSFA